MTGSDRLGPMGGGQRESWTGQTATTAPQTEDDSASQMGIKGEDTYVDSGGDVATNDGSESNPVRMGGRSHMGGQDGMRGQNGMEAF